MKKIFLVLSLFTLFTFVHYDEVQADTYAVGGDVYVTSDLNSATYSPGEQIRARNISMTSYSPMVNQVQLSAGANGGSATLLSQAISNGQTIFGSDTLIGYAPSSGGTYNASFSAAMNAPAGSAYIEVLCKNAFYCAIEFRGEDGSYNIVDNLSDEYGDSVPGWPGLIWRKKQVSPYFLYRAYVYDASDCSNGYTMNPSNGSNQYLTPGQSFKVEIECLPDGGM